MCRGLTTRSSLRGFTVVEARRSRLDVASAAPWWTGAAHSDFEAKEARRSRLDAASAAPCCGVAGLWIRRRRVA